MLYYAEPLTNLIVALNKLPGIGPKTAQRLAFYLLAAPREEAEALAQAILKARERVIYCSSCFNFTDRNPCWICQDETRDRHLICVVEEPRDIVAFEKTREYQGLYHVLHGVLSPLNGVTPEDLKIKELLSRLEGQKVEEVIVATNPSTEGETTALYLARLLKPLGIKVTRLAHGLPVGGELEYADQATLVRALEGRREMS